MADPGADVTNDSFSGTVSALARFATGVVVLSVRDSPDHSDDDPSDDLATTVTAFMPVSLFPPLVAVSVDAEGYLAEVLERQDDWGVSVLTAGQAALAGRFSAAGRPSARLLLAGVAHHRGTHTGALLLEDDASLECRTTQRQRHGDHLLLIGAVLDVRVPSGPGRPLVRYDRSYRRLTD